jgi:hypothetical protein
MSIVAVSCVKPAEHGSSAGIFIDQSQHNTEM